MLDSYNTQRKVNLGKYGLMRWNYLKSYKKVLYNELLLDNKLAEHLLDIDKTATKQVNRIIKAMAEQHGTNEKLKVKWLDLMNNYKHCAEECIQSLIYD